MTHIQVNAQTIRRGLVSLMLPPLDAAWEAYRFRTVNREYPAKARLRSELRLEAAVSGVMEAA